MTDPTIDAEIHNEKQAQRDMSYNREAALDVQYEHAIREHNQTAFHLIACDEYEPIAEFLKLAAQASRIGNGPSANEFRRKLCDDLMQVGHKCWTHYAEAYS